MPTDCDVNQKSEPICVLLIQSALFAVQRLNFKEVKAMQFSKNSSKILNVYICRRSYKSMSSKSLRNLLSWHFGKDLPEISLKWDYFW